MVNPKIQAIIDGRRNEAIGRVQHAFAEDVIDLAELERLLDLVELAETTTALEVVTQDLPALRSSESRALTVSDTDEATLSKIAVLSNNTYRGSFRVPRSISATSIMGHLTFDFTNADFSVGVCELSCNAIGGQIDLVVPSHVRVEIDGLPLLGGFEAELIEPEAPDAPVLKVGGLAFCGQVSVRNPSWKEEIQRVRDHAIERRRPSD